MALQFEEQRVAFSGKLGGSTLREARQLVKELGGIVADPSAEDAVEPSAEESDELPVMKGTPRRAVLSKQWKLN